MNDIYMLGTRGKSTLVIYTDYDCESPREWDNLGHLILFGRDTEDTEIGTITEILMN